MELMDLQNIWSEYDQKLSENIRINKEVLKHLLMDKPYKRVSGMTRNIVIELLISTIILVVAIINFPFRNEWQYWVGVTMFALLIIWDYYWHIRYFRMAKSVDFTKPITETRKRLKEIEIHKLRRIQIGYGLGPVGVIGIILICGFHFNSEPLTYESILFIALTVLVFVVSLFIRYRYGLVERFKKFRNELNELEDLEKE